MAIKDIDPHDRPRERLISKGPANLKDTELLAILIRSGTRGKSALDWAGAIVKRYRRGELGGLDYGSFCRITELPSTAACAVMAAIELCRRASEPKDGGPPVIDKPADIIALTTGFRSARKEQFVVYYLNARRHLITSEVVSVGTVNASIVHPREVFEPAVRVLASQIVLVHNHPSGDPQPSDADIRLTEQLSAVGQMMGIEIVDHIIVSDRSYYSFTESGLLQKNSVE